MTEGNGMNAAAELGTEISVEDKIEERYGNGKKAEAKPVKKTETNSGDKPADDITNKKDAAVEENTDGVLPGEKPAAQAAGKKDDENIDNQDGKKELDFFDPLDETITVQHQPGDINDPTQQPAAKPTVELTKDQLEREQNYEKYKKSHELLSQLDTPLGKLLKEAEESGKPFWDVLAEVQYTDYSKVDYSKLDDKGRENQDRQIATEYFSKVDKLEGKELEDAVEEFATDTEGVAKRRERKNQITALNNLQSERMNKYIGTISDNKNKQSQNQTLFIEGVDKFIEQAKQKGNAFGMQLTDDVTPKFAESAKNFFKRIFNPDGSANVPFIMASTFFADFGRKRMRDIAETAKSEGELNILNKVVNPDENASGSSNRRPQASEKNMETLIDDKFGGQTNS